MAYEVTDEDNPYFTNYGTTIKPARFDVQIKLSKLSIWCGNCKVETEVSAVYSLRLHARML
eukprot:14542615-Ditylum_brightwellii.AAC.2